MLATFSFLSWAGAAEPSGSSVHAESHEDLIDVGNFVSGIVIDLKYATSDNFAHKKLYASNRCFVRRGTAEKLAKVQKELEARRLGLKIYDGYRPLPVQRAMWKLVPDSRYVADPRKGSRHNRGAAVDVTLVDHKGKELLMPTGFDDFTPRAAANFQAVSEEMKKNRTILQEVMKNHGFTPLKSEWWHFDDENWRRYPLMETTIEEIQNKVGKSAAVVIYEIKKTQQDGKNLENGKPAVKLLPLKPAHVGLIESSHASSRLPPQSTNSYGSERAHDGQLETAWVEGVKGYGAGEWIQFDFKDRVLLSGFSIYAGYGKSPDIYYKNSRVKSLELTSGSGRTWMVECEDKMGFNRYELDVPVGVKSLRMTIKSFFKGDKYDDTAICEFEFR